MCSISQPGQAGRLVGRGDGSAGEGGGGERGADTGAVEDIFVGFPISYREISLSVLKDRY